MYTSCPLKYRLAKESDDIKSHDAKHVITAALRDTYLKHLHMVGAGRPWSKKAAGAYFSRAWASRKSSFVHKSSKKITTTLLRAHEKVLDINSWIPSGHQVAVAEMPFERRIRDIVVSDTVDGIIIKKLKRQNISVAELWIFDDTINGVANHDFGATLRALLGYSYVRKTLIDSRTQLTCHIVNVYHGTKRELSLSKEQRINYPRILRDIAESIESDIFYPHSSRNNCEHCFFSDECHWSSV